MICWRPGVKLKAGLWSVALHGRYRPSSHTTCPALLLFPACTHCSELAGGAGSVPRSGVDWGQIYEYLVVAVRAAVILRLGLDDENASVASAAAAGLAALLVAPAGEATLWEAAGASAAAGWPVPWQGALRRLVAGGTWEAASELLRQVGGASRDWGRGGKDVWIPSQFTCRPRAA
jgi:hypothetical protein